MRMPAFAVLVAAVLAAGCSDPDGTPSAQPTTPPVTTPPPVTTAPPSPTPSPTPEDPLSPQPGLESPAPLGVPACKGSALTVTDADTIVVPAWRQEVYVLRTSGPACQLEGYPTVAFRDASGRAMAIRTQHGGYGLPSEQPQPVTLSRTTTLSFVIASSRDGACSDVARVLVRLPGTDVTHTVTTQLRVCGTTVGLSPVERRTEAHDD